MWGRAALPPLCPRTPPGVWCGIHASADQRRAALQLRGQVCIHLVGNQSCALECHSVYSVEGGGKKISHSYYSGESNY